MFSSDLLDIPSITSICTAQRQLCQDLGWQPHYHDLYVASAIAACWNIVLQIESNRRRTFHHARYLRQPGDTVITVLLPLLID
jgi:hypothetical protein